MDPERTELINVSPSLHCKKFKEDVVFRDRQTISRAVEALLKWNKTKSKTQKPQLFEQDDFIYLILTLKKIPQNGRKNPFKIPLPHPIHPFDASEEFCLIIDDRSDLTSQIAKKKIQSENIPISKVIKLSKLKTDYRPFEAKRKLCNSYDMFFADKRIIPLLPRLLGKEFFKKKKIPLPIDLTHKNWKEQVQRCCESALFYLSNGTCSVIKVARESQGQSLIVKNVIAAVDGAVEIIPKKLVNVRSIHLKMSESLALPVYQSVPQLGLKIEGANKEVVEEESNVESGEEGVVEVKEKKKPEKKKPEKKKAKKGRIHEVRYMDPKIGQFMDDDVSSGGDDDDAENVNDDLGNAELTGNKRKKVEKKQVHEEMNGEKELKKSGKVKKGDGAKKKKKKDLPLEGDGEELEVHEEMVENVSVSSEAKKKKKVKSKIGKLGGAEAKKAKKKSKRSA